MYKVHKTLRVMGKAIVELLFTKPLHTSTGEHSVELMVDQFKPSQHVADSECLETPSWEGTQQVHQGFRHI